jgi:large repetitive protein
VTFTALVNPVPGSPTGVVSFFADGAPFASAAIDPSTGLATLTTSALGVGSHTITAAYGGNANILGSQSAAYQQVVNRAASASDVSGHAVRNRRGRIVKVDLDAAVQAVSPGGGTPTGVVTFFQGQRRLGTAALSGGTAEPVVKPGLVLNKAVMVQYTGDANFRPSVSPNVLITRRSITAAARPFTAFFAGSRGPAARTMARHTSHAHRI